MFNIIETRREIDAATTTVDTESDALELARMAADAVREGEQRSAEFVAILASIPPIKLGRTVYRVVYGGCYGFDLAGPRGGHSCLVRNLKNPALWAHNTGGTSIKTTWYRREADGSFTRID